MKVKVSNKRCNKITLVLLSVGFFGVNSVFAQSWTHKCPSEHLALKCSWNSPSNPWTYTVCGGTHTLCVGGDDNYAPNSGCGCCAKGHYDKGLTHYCR